MEHYDYDARMGARRSGFIGDAPEVDHLYAGEQLEAQPCSTKHQSRDACRRFTKLRFP